MPKASELIKHDIVLISEARFREEDRNVNPLANVQASHSEEQAQEIVKANVKCRSRLLSVHWRRIIVDEGHVIGSANIMTDFAQKLYVDHCWIVSGTPTKQFNADPSLISSTNKSSTVLTVQ